MINHKLISFSVVQIYDLSYIHLHNAVISVTTWDFNIFGMPFLLFFYEKGWELSEFQSIHRLTVKYIFANSYRNLNIIYVVVKNLIWVKIKFLGLLTLQIY